MLRVVPDAIERLTARADLRVSFGTGSGYTDHSSDGGEVLTAAWVPARDVSELVGQSTVLRVVSVAQLTDSAPYARSVADIASASCHCGTISPAQAPVHGDPGGCGRPKRRVREIGKLVSLASVSHRGCSRCLTHEVFEHSI